MAIRNTNLGGTDWQDTGASTLNGAIDDSVTTITLTDASSFKTAGVILIEDEIITYTGVSTNDLTGCTRGAYSTTAVSHLDTTAVAEKEVLLYNDLNDTFDAAYEKVKAKTDFWNTTEWFTVYDAFAASISGSLWTTSGTAAHSATNNAGGDASGEAKITSTGDGTNTPAHIISNALPQNKYAYHFKGYVELSGAGAVVARSATVSFRQRDGTNTTIFSMSSSQEMTGTFNFSILVIKTATDTYDVYMGGKNIVTISDSDLEIGVYCQGTGGAGNTQIVDVYIDDVRYTNE